MNPLSWERSYTSSNNNKSSRASKSSSSKLDLLTFGYGCKLFNDEDQARYLDQGKNLIPFDGDSNLLIDRSVGFLSYFVVCI